MILSENKKKTVFQKQLKSDIKPIGLLQQNEI